METTRHELRYFRGGELEQIVPWQDGDGRIAGQHFNDWIAWYPASRVDYIYADADEPSGTRVVQKAQWNDRTGELEDREFDATAASIEFHRPILG